MTYQQERRRDRDMSKTREDYTYLAAQQAFDWRGEGYADYIEKHTAELEAKGYRVGERSLGEALSGNDGD